MSKGINSAEGSGESFLEVVESKDLLSTMMAMFEAAINNAPKTDAYHVGGVGFQNIITDAMPSLGSGMSYGTFYENHGNGYLRREFDINYHNIVLSVSPLDGRLFAYAGILNGNEPKTRILLENTAYGGDDSFGEAATYVRSALSTQEAQFLTAISAKDFCRMQIIMKFCKECDEILTIDWSNLDAYEEHRGDIEPVLSVIKDVFQPTLQLIEALDAAKNIPPIEMPADTPNIIANEQSLKNRGTELHPAVFSHALHIFYAVAHWCMQDAIQKMQALQSSATIESSQPQS